MNDQRILYVVSEPWYFANHRLDHAMGLMEAGFDVHVATRTGDRLDEIRAAGCTVHPIAISRGRATPGEWWKEMRRVRAIVEESRPDVVHAVALKPIALTLPLLIGRRPALVLGVNGLGISAVDSSRSLAAFRRLLRMVGRRRGVRLLFQTRSDQAAVSGDDDGSLGTVIPGVGVDIAEFTPHPTPVEPPLRVVFLGRAVRSKGLTDLADAACDSRLAEHQIEIHAYCALDHASPGALTAAELNEIGEAEQITVHPPTSSPERVLADADAAILPSRAGEGVSKFVLESLASGTPILLSENSGSGEIIDHGVHGLVFSSADPSALADALIEFSTWSPERRCEVSTAARRLAEERFSTDVIVPAIIALHLEVIEERHR